MTTTIKKAVCNVVCLAWAMILLLAAGVVYTHIGGLAGLLSCIGAVGYAILIVHQMSGDF